MIKGARLAVVPSNHGEYLGEVFASQKRSLAPVATAKIIEAFLEE